MRPWYMPPAYGDGAGGPRSVKCHSCRLFSESGAAWKVGFGCFAAADNSCASFKSRRMVGDGAIAFGDRGTGPAGVQCFTAQVGLQSCCLNPVEPLLL